MAANTRSAPRRSSRKSCTSATRSAIGPQLYSRAGILGYVMAVRVRACLLAALCVVAAAAPASAAVPRDWLGVMVDGPMTDPATDVGDEWTRLGDSGAGHVRAEFYW